MAPQTLSKLAKDLKPYIVPWIVAATGQSGSSSGGGTSTGERYYAGDGLDLDGSNVFSVNASALVEADGGLADTSNNLYVVAGDGIAVDAGGVAVGLATNPGLEFSGGLLRAKVSNGLELLSSGINVDLATNSGLTFSSGDLALGTPSTLSASTSNAVSGTGHSHAVTAVSDGDATKGALLKTNVSGYLKTTSFETSGAADIGQGLTAGNTGFRVINHTHDYDHVHVVINPGGSWSLDEQFGLDIDDNLLVRGWIVGKHAIQLEGAKMLVHFDGPEPYETNFKGNPTGHMGQVATVSGGTIYRTGKFGKAIQIAPATTNLVTNPSFETGTSGWSDYSTGSATGTRTRITTASKFGTYAYRLAKSGGADTDRWGTYTSFAVVAGTTYTFSVWLNIASIGGGGQDVRLYVEGALTPAAKVINSGVTDGWVRYHVTAAATSTGTAYAHVWIYDASVAAVYIDGAQVEATQHMTPYCDGSLGDGHSWSGTAHASTSSRTVAQLSYGATQAIQANRGTFMTWLALSDASGAFNLTQPGIMRWWNAFNTESMYLYFSNSGDRIWFTSYSGSVLQTNISEVIAWAADDWHHVALTWDSNDVNLYIDGALVETATTYAAPAITSDVIAIGQQLDSGRTMSGFVDEVAFLDRALDADTVRAVYESNAPVFAETSTWHWRAGRNRIYADAEGLWGYGANNGAIIGLYAGDEENASATKSWGGVSLSEGDLLIGNTTSGYLWWDDDATNKLRLTDADINLYDSAQLITRLSKDLGLAFHLADSQDNPDVSRTVSWYRDIDNASTEDPILDLYAYYSEPSSVPTTYAQVRSGYHGSGKATLYLSSGPVGSAGVGAYLSLRADYAGVDDFAQLWSYQNTQVISGGEATLQSSDDMYIRSTAGGTIEIKSIGGPAISIPSGVNFGQDDLDTYAEAESWTPTITGSGSNPTVTYTTQSGKYTQIGNTVFFSFMIQINTIAGGSGNVRISLPATAANTGLADNTRNAAWLYGVNVSGANTAINVNFSVSAGAAYGLYLTSYDDAAQYVIAVSDLAAGDYLGASGFYFV